MYDFDLVIIGGTSEGLAAARTARALGAKVAVVESGTISGEELQAGHIPLGALIKAACVFKQCQESMEFGIRSDNVRVTWSAVKLRIADVRDDVRALWHQQLKECGIELIKGAARFEDAHTLLVTDKNGTQPVRAAKYILATGHVPQEPQIAGLAETGYLTPAQFFTLPEMPRSLTLLGNGAYAVELAFALARLGCKVTVLYRDAALLPEEDHEISAFAEKLLQQEGVVLHARADIQGAEIDGERKQIVFETNGEVQHAQSRHILPLPQYRIDLTSLNIEAAGVAWSSQAVQADEYLQAAPNVWICGGLTGKGANASGAQAARGLFTKPHNVQRVLHYVAETSSRVLFTVPGMASLGLSETQARAKWNDVQIFSTSFSQLERAIIEGETRGFVKLVTGDNGRILGVHIAGQNAGELLTPFIMAMQHGPQTPQWESLTSTLSEGVQQVLAQYAQAVTRKIDPTN